MIFSVYILKLYSKDESQWTKKYEITCNIKEKWVGECTGVVWTGQMKQYCFPKMMLNGKGITELQAISMKGGWGD